MHELAVCQALIAQIEDIAAQRAARVRQVFAREWDRCRELSRNCSHDAYPLACAGTAAEGSRLEIEETGVRVRCRTCSAETDGGAEPLGVRRFAAIGTPT